MGWVKNGLATRLVPDRQLRHTSWQLIQITSRIQLEHRQLAFASAVSNRWCNPVHQLLTVSCDGRIIVRRAHIGGAEGVQPLITIRPALPDQSSLQMRHIDRVLAGMGMAALIAVEAVGSPSVTDIEHSADFVTLDQRIVLVQTRTSGFVSV